MLVTDLSLPAKPMSKARLRRII